MHHEHTLQLISSCLNKATLLRVNLAVGFALRLLVALALLVLHFVVLSCPLSGVASREPLLFSTICCPFHVVIRIFLPHAAPRALTRTVFHVVCWLLHKHHSPLRSLRVEVAGSRAVVVALAFRRYATHGPLFAMV